MEKVMKEHSTKYQLLFKKYIDNQLVLFIQESKFPSSIAFTLVEPSSRLMWKTSYEPSTEIVTPSSFSVIDQGSFESFMSVVYDSVVSKSIISLEDSINVNHGGNWHTTSPKESVFYNEQINDKLHITILKKLGKLHIRLKNP